MALRVAMPQPEEMTISQRVSHGLPRMGSDRKGHIPKFEPTEAQRHIVAVLAANSATHVMMAEALRIKRTTLVKYFADDIKRGLAQINVRIGATVVERALMGDMSAARLWLTTHGGKAWRVPKESEPQLYDERADPEEVVHFYLPKNFRDEPEEIEPPTIEADPLPKTGTDDA